MCVCPSLRMVLGVCDSTECLQDAGSRPVCPVSSCGLVRVHLLQPEACSLPLRCVCSNGWKRTKLCLHWGKQTEIHTTQCCATWRDRNLCKGNLRMNVKGRASALLSALSPVSTRWCASAASSSFASASTPQSSGYGFSTTTTWCLVTRLTPTACSSAACRLLATCYMFV